MMIKLWMDLSITHGRSEESIEAKTRWFKSLSLPERMEIMCAVIDLALETNPDIAEFKDAEQASGRIRIISETRR